MNPEAVITAYIAAINAQDVDAIVALSSADHAFIDAHGNTVPAASLAAGWRGYFTFMPRYGIDAEHILAQGNAIAVFGQAWGELATGGAWRRPAAWRAALRDGLITRWQVYVDTKPVFDLLPPPP